MTPDSPATPSVLPDTLPSALVDPYARAVTYLRLSVTDRCDLRCVYCMSEHMTFLPKAELLTLEELHRLTTLFVTQGIRKLRITGGEPLVRRNVISLFQSMHPLLARGELDEVTLTTNGTLLPKYAEALYAAGVRRVNVSLDSVDSATYLQLTRRGDLQVVLAGLEAAKQAGLHVKINAVALKQHTLAQLEPLLQFCADHGFDLTFIEVMPMGDIGNEQRFDQFLPLSEVEQAIASRYQVVSRPRGPHAGPAEFHTLPELGITVGFISPLTRNFCASCNRIRLTCTGRLYLCLGQEEALDFRQPLRDNASDAEIISLIHQAMRRKPKGHDFVITQGDPNIAVPRHMSTTGG